MKLPRYFETYGGLNSVVTSKYFYASVVLAVLCSGYFQRPEWWSLSISVIPGLVGFAIAGVAIFISLGSDALRGQIAGRRTGETSPSPFIAFMAMFTHFIVVQLLALVCSILSKAMYMAEPLPGFAELADGLRAPFWFLGGLLFSYSLMLCVSLAVEIYRLAAMIDDYQSAVNKTEGR